MGQFSSRAIDHGYGLLHQAIRYEDLRLRLSPEDFEYVKSIDEVLRAYEKQWNSVFKEIPMASGLQKARLESQLEYLAQRLSKELSRILKFVEEQMGMTLDDHYLAIRDIVTQR